MGTIKHIITLTYLFIATANLYAGGVVYLIIGSDTAIWNGMSTNRYNNFYNIDLYTNPSRNAYTVMDPNFRASLKDSYGTPLKMTWWMMAGNIFRYATNNNVPVPNIMTLYLMKKYHGENVKINGDELSLHYHTFFWSDYDGDGVYYWNQSKTFLESLDDFKITLAEFLLEEETFPVSFRSGWHYMDNDWQHYLNQKVLPYSMHNDYPSKRTFDEEPIDNIFDWSRTPTAWKPYRPSYADYQIPGMGKGWNIRSISFQRAIRNNYLDSLFSAASSGDDQIACLWAHLPEADFPQNIIIIDSLAHKMEEKYPEVTFKYCSAIEGMKLWRKTGDNEKPNLTITEVGSGDKVYYEISSDENIFQDEPFVAIRDINSIYSVAKCNRLGENYWRTRDSYYRTDLVKVGVSVCDTLGNQTNKVINYMPEVFIDNLDHNYSEQSDNWISSKINAWGTDSRVAQLSEKDSAVAKWNYTIPKSSYYNIFTQVPSIQNMAEKFQYLIKVNDEILDTVRFDKKLAPDSWIYLKTLNCFENDNVEVIFQAFGRDNPNMIACVDAIKVSSIVKEKELSIDKTIIQLDEIVVNDTINYELSLNNYGTKSLKIFGISSLQNSLISKYDYPIVIPAMGSVSITTNFSVSKIGEFTDSLLVLSDDSKNSKMLIPIQANVLNYFTTVDNEDVNNYYEFGEWKTSVATANGLSSRYAYLNASPKAFAEFETSLKKTGLYDVYEIVPKTENASNNAHYIISMDDAIFDSIYADQNSGSGKWKLLGSYYFSENGKVKIKVEDTGESTEGVVLRADAFKLQLVEETTSIEKNDNNQISFRLNQNYPNPFNPTTTISFQVAKTEHIKVEIFNLLGENILTLYDEELQPGLYNAIWKGKNKNDNVVSSGVYFYRMSSEHFSATKKMIFLR